MSFEKSRLLVCVTILATVAALAVGAARADFTYVDATPSNTGPSAAFGAADDDKDNLWYNDTSRTYALGGAVLASFGGTGSGFENSPKLTTTVSGLANGVYDVSVIYWTNPGDWHIQAAISGQSLVTFNKSSEATAIGTYSNLTQWRASLGTVNVTNGSFAVDVDDHLVHVTGDFRSWYDGVAYQAQSVPEPNAILLLVSGLVGLLAYAWRRRRQLV